MTRLIDADKLPNIYTATHQEMIMAFEESPTVEAEPVRHGKWIYGENLDGFDGYRCSHCMTHFAVDDVSDYHYCPNCGAKMDERKDNDTDRMDNQS